jgi:hypothetical protein
MVSESVDGEVTISVEVTEHNGAYVATSPELPEIAVVDEDPELIFGEMPHLILLLCEQRGGRNVTVHPLGDGTGPVRRWTVKTSGGCVMSL